MSLAVPCPKCSKKLKLPGREVLGKPAKCPACGHRFVLKVSEKSEQPAKKSRPDMVATQESSREKVPAKAGPVPVLAAPVGLEARYVFDRPAGSRVAAPPTETSTAVASEATPSFPAAEPAAGPFDFAAVEEPTAFSPASIDAPSFDPGAIVGGDTMGASGIEEATTTAASRTAAFKERRAAKKKRNTIMGVSAAAVLAVVGSAVVLLLPDPAPQTVAGGQTASQPVVEKTSLQIESPTRGEPIPTNLLPAGVGLVVHLRPAELWNSTAAKGTIAALPPSLKPWAEQAIVRYGLRQPSEISELTIGVVFGARGVPPEVAAVVRTVNPKPLGDFLQEFPGETERFGEMRLIKTAERAIFVADEQTFAVAPPALGDELADSVSGPNGYLSAGINQIMDQSDRDRLFSVVVGTDDFDIQSPGLLTEELIDLANVVINGLENPLAFIWSVHPGENLYSEFTVQPRAGVNPVAAEQKILASLSKAPANLVTRLKLHNPAVPGVREIVGRFPAMLEATRLSTDVVADTRNGVVDLRTLLPSEAGPNLALGTVLTYNVMAVEPVSAQPSQPAAAVATDTRTVAEKILTKVDGQFSRTPLQEALAYLAEEGKFELEIDGDALKFAGYTKNMAQTFEMGEVTIKEALRQITVQYDKMAVAIDEKSGKLIVLTKQFAEQRGLQPISLEE